MGRTFLALSRTSSPALLVRRHRRVHRRNGFRPALSFLEDRTLLSTMIWTNPAGGDWDTASNWVNSANPSDSHVPTAADDAVINTTGITVTVSGEVSVNSLDSEAAIVVSGGSLTLAQPSTMESSLEVSGNASLNGILAVEGQLTVYNSASLSGTAALISTGTFTWAGGGTISISSINAQGGAAIHGDYTSYLAGLRDATALAKLPEDEQKACRALWTEVDVLLAKVLGTDPKSGQ